MKKIFTLFAALIAVTSVMAQMPSTMKFVGKSSYTATIYGITASGGADNDELVVSDIDADKMTSSIAIPSMTVTVTAMGFTKTIPAMTLTAVPFTMSYTGGMTITWKTAENETLTYTVKEGNEDKKVEITNLSGTYTSSSKTMSLTFNMKYGSMPGTLTFTENDAAYQGTTAISELTADEQNSEAKVRKAVINGKIVIIKSQQKYNAAGALIK